MFIIAPVNAQPPLDLLNRSPDSRLNKDERMFLSMNDCLLTVLQNNHDVRLTREGLVQSDATIDQARAAMLPYLGAEATYTRLDEELSFSVTTLSMTFIDRDLYRRDRSKASSLELTTIEPLPLASPSALTTIGGCWDKA